MLLDKNLYPAIYTRKTTREYTGVLLERPMLDEVQNYISTLVPLFPEKGFKLDLQTHKDGTYRLMAFSEKDALANVNIGFVLQQLDLFLQTKGIGSRWFGMEKKPKDLVREYRPLEYAICLQFGTAAGSINRDNTVPPRRKELEAITNSMQYKDVIEAARIAPSAVNSQPWFFAQDGSDIHVYCKRQNIIENMLYGRMNMYDIGIAVCHLVLSFKNIGINVSVKMQDTPPVMEKHKYILTLNIGKTEK